MKWYKLAICFLPLLAEGSSSEAASPKPPVGQSVSQRIETKCSQSVRAARIRVQPHKLADNRSITYLDFIVCVISADGTALGRYMDFVGIPNRTSRKKIDAAISKRAIDAAAKRQYQLLAADGKSYEYKLAAFGADCNTVILKPANPIPAQPYLDISRLAVPVLAQRYRTYTGPNDPIYREKPRMGSIIVGGIGTGPMSFGNGLIFRDSDGSFIGYNSSIGAKNVVMNSTKPLMSFIEANSTVRFKKKPEPKAVYSDLYRRILTQMPPYMQYLFQSSKTKHYLNARFLRFDGLAVDHIPVMDKKTAKTTQIAMWDNREHMMRFVRLDSGLAGGLWMPVEKLKIRALMPAKPMKRQLKPNEIIFGVEYDDFTETPVVIQTKVTAVSGHTVFLDKSSLWRWIFTADAQPIGKSVPDEKTGRPVLLRLDELQQRLSKVR